MSTRMRPSLSPRSRCSSRARSRSSAPIRPRSINSCPSGVAEAIKLEFLFPDQFRDFGGGQMFIDGVEQLLLTSSQDDAFGQIARVLPLVVEEKRFHDDVFVSRKSGQDFAGAQHLAPHHLFERFQSPYLAIVHGDNLG